ncbi:hypothetical protein ACFORL_03480 [Legionella dresdenensis]|uniref:Interaptin n=1 Tax=Legionella dresdenensis TaxID=450200 RepID=A0ABV8CCV5_9GAMM
MTIKNNELLQILTTINEKAVPDADILQALDALLAAGNDLPKFREALKSQAKFWTNAKIALAPNAEAIKNDDTFLTAAGNGEADKIESLLRVAARQRAMLALKAADDAYIINIIQKDVPDDLRKFLIDNTPKSGIKAQDIGGNHTSTAVIDNEYAENIRRQAITLHLQKTINKLPADQSSLDKLNRLKEKEGDLSAKIQALGIAQPIADKMVTPVTVANVKEDILLRQFTIRLPTLIQGRTNEQLANNLIDFDAFLNGEGFAELTNENKKKEAKAQLGNIYLERATAAINDINTLKAIGREKNLVNLRASFKRPGQNDTFLDEVLTERNQAIVQNRAAQRALSLAIAATTDITALKAIAGAKNTQMLTLALSNHKATGFADAENNELRTKAVTDANRADIVAIAHVQLHLLQANADQAAALIEPGTPETLKERFVGQFHNQQNPLPNHITDEHIQKYFASPKNVLTARRMALISFARQNLKNVAPEALTQNPDAAWVQANLNKNAAGLFDESFTAEFKKHMAAAQALQTLAAQPATPAGNQQLIAHINGDNHNLPASDKHKLQAEVTTMLINNCEPGKSALVQELATAGNEEKFKETLGKFGINQRDWVNSATMEQVQKAACSRSLESQVKSASLAPGGHQELLSVLKSRDLSQQRKILADSRAIPALVNAKSVTELRDMLGVPSSELRGVEREQTRQQLVQKFYNSTLAEVLATNLSQVALSEDKVKTINNLLLAANEIDASLLQRIRGALGVNPQDFNAVFTADIVEEMKRQHQFNQDLFTAYRNPAVDSVDKKAMEAFLLLIPKNDSFSTACLTAFKDAMLEKNRQDCIAKINQKEALVRVLPEGWQAKLTTDLFNQLKQTKSQTDYIANFSTQLAADKQKLQTLITDYDKFETVHQQIVEEIERLSAVNDMLWLTPGFQGTAKNNANKVRDHFKRIAGGCDLIVNHLQYQQNSLQGLLASLPSNRSSITDKENLKALEKHKKEIESHLAAVEENLAFYQKMQRKLYGNPDKTNSPLAKHGILNLVEQAYHNRMDVTFTGFDCTINDYPIGEKDAHIDKAWQGKVVDQSGMTNLAVNSSAASKGYSYGERSHVADGFFREYAIKCADIQEQNEPPKPDVGYFIEERHGEAKAKTQDGKTRFEPSVTFTLAKFPESKAGRVKYAMAAATQILANLDGPPGKDAIVLGGKNTEEVKYIWTALMILGKHTPNMRFGAEAIKISAGTGFVVKDEYNFVGRWSDQSCYSKHFKDNPDVKKYCEGLKNLADEKKRSEKGKDQVIADAQNASKNMKDGLNELKGVTPEPEKPTFRP